MHVQPSPQLQQLAQLCHIPFATSDPSRLVPVAPIYFLNWSVYCIVNNPVLWYLWTPYRYTLEPKLEKSSSVYFYDVPIILLATLIE